MVHLDSNLPVKNKSYYFQKDSLKVFFFFWEEKGRLFFTINNDSQNDLYIDWKRSSYIQNGISYSFWENKSEFYGETTTLDYLFDLNGDGEGIPWSSSSTKITEYRNDQITHLPPRTKIFFQDYSLMNFPKFSFDSEFAEIPDFADSTKKIEAAILKYNKNNTPLNFRVYLTMSFDEKFDEKIILDEEFFVDKLIEFEVAKADPDSLGFNDGRYFYFFKSKDQSMLNYQQKKKR
jgi:hypothetical protein